MNVDDKKLSDAEQQIINAHNIKLRERQLENTLAESATRSRSVTVGTAFGGASEVSMRRMDGTVIFAILQAVEVVELIHQMAASIGCCVHIQPRKDFASWRSWKNSEVGATLPPPEQQPGLKPALMAKETQNEQTLATEKTVKRRSPKRAAKTT